MAALAHLYRRVWAQGSGASPPEHLRAWLELPSCQPEVNCFLAQEESTLVGYALVSPEPLIDRAVVEGGVHPLHRRRGIGRQLLLRALARAQELGVTHVHVAAQESPVAAQGLLTSAGLHPVCRHWRMRREPGPLAAPSLPPGVAITSFQEGDEETLARIQNAAFADSWGFSPNSAENIYYRVRLPGCHPEGILFARRAGEVVAYCWTRLGGPPEASTGVIWMTGVHPEHRGAGLGRAILLAGLRYLTDQGVHCVELTVDEANASARQLYLSEGFRDVSSLCWYEKTLQGE